MELPKKYDPKVEEPRWQKFWEENNIYKFDPDDSKREVYSVDTPPPTISGKMHMGHAFSYSQQDFVIRFQRMLGKNVFYPFGTDNNGVATERLIEQMKKVVARNMKREDFVKLCLETVHKELIPRYVNDMKSIALSCDWDIFYDTIDEHSQRISQRSFIELYEQGREYRKDAPSMWCPECQTGISQVECQDKEMDSFFNDIIFKVGDENLTIATTRPELLPACVAVFYHPDDTRYQKFKGKKAKVPLFNFEVPIMPDERANPEKGTGIVMCCTFGDQTDMEWQKAHDLPIKIAITTDGRMTEIAGKYAGMKTGAARKMMIDDMKEQELLTGQKPIKHAVNTHERCGTEVEYIKSKQWFIKYLDLKEDMLKWGAELNWFPQHMKVRYDNWVNGLQWDWLISRQRFFGIPFPVWYCKECEEIILADKENLPVDPLKDRPPVDKCPKCGSTDLEPEKDILDTWATSSLSPRLAIELFKDKPIFKKLYPMSLRPQAHDIITFWLFNTVVKSNFHWKQNPWADVMIAGHAQDPHRQKMSKSKGNVVEPQKVVEQFSADALRFWAAGSKLGDDLPYQEKDVATGEKMVTKLWNASKFSIMNLEDFDVKAKPKLEVIDRWILTKLNKIIKVATESFSIYEYSKTKAETEKFFWQVLCDNYLEIIKDRIYNPDQYKEKRTAAQYALYHSLLGVIKMMAPIMPHITEAVYQLYFADKEKCKSVHISRWPEYDESLVDEEAEKAGDIAVEIISLVRKAKSDNKMSLKEEIAGLTVRCNEEEKKLVGSVMDDIKATTKAREITFGEDADLEVGRTGLKLGIQLR